jgi:hypothetical protein
LRAMVQTNDGYGNRGDRRLRVQREGVSRAANDERSKELAEGLGVERVRLDL